MNQTRHRKLSIFIPELVGGGGEGVLAVVSPHLTTQPFPQGPCRHTVGSCFPEGPAPEGREAKTRRGRTTGGYLPDASSQVKAEKLAPYLLSFKYQNKGIQCYSFHLKLMDNEMQDQ